MIRMVYFASLREQIGRSGESIDLPAEARCVRDESYASALARGKGHPEPQGAAS